MIEFGKELAKSIALCHALRMKRLFAIVCIFLGAFFLGAIFYAASQASIISSSQQILSDVWGQVMLLDLYLGFFCFFLLAWHSGMKKGNCILLFLVSCILGNLIPLMVLAWLFLVKTAGKDRA